MTATSNIGSGYGFAYFRWISLSGESRRYFADQGYRFFALFQNVQEGWHL